MVCLNMLEMKSKILYLIVLLLFGSYDSFSQKLVDDLGERHPSYKSKSLVFDVLRQNGLNDNFEIFVVYVLDASCSKCIFDYLCFLKSLDGTPYFENVVVLVENQDDFLSVDFYRSKYEISTPKNEVLIFDLKSEVLSFIKSEVGYCNILLFEKGCLKCCYNVNEYKCDDNMQLIR